MSAAEIEQAAQPLLGQWKCDPSKSEKFEEFLAAMGTHIICKSCQHQHGSRSSPQVTLFLVSST